MENFHTCQDFPTFSPVNVLFVRLQDLQDMLEGLVLHTSLLVKIAITWSGFFSQQILYFKPSASEKENLLDWETRGLQVFTAAALLLTDLPCWQYLLTAPRCRFSPLANAIAPIGLLLPTGRAAQKKLEKLRRCVSQLHVAKLHFGNPSLKAVCVL